MSDIAPEHSYTSCADDDLTNIGWCKRCTDLALAERVTLLAWKAGAREVMDGIDIQAVGKELGVKLGRPIGPEILPGIRELLSLLSRAAEVLDTVGDWDFRGRAVREEWGKKEYNTLVRDLKERQP